MGLLVLGIRSVGIPVVVSAVGRISGAFWALLLCADYRIAATATTFLTPIWGKPESLRTLVGHAATVQLSLFSGTKDSIIMLETGVVHQLRRSTEDSRKAAVETAKRIAHTPSMACNKSPFIMNPAVEEYAVDAVDVAQGQH